MAGSSWVLAGDELGEVVDEPSESAFAECDVQFTGVGRVACCGDERGGGFVHDGGAVAVVDLAHEDAVTGRGCSWSAGRGRLVAGGCCGKGSRRRRTDDRLLGGSKLARREAVMPFPFRAGVADSSRLQLPAEQGRFSARATVHPSQGLLVI